MAEYTVSVEGMTCDHCVSAVTKEITALDGVSGVSIELNTTGISRVSVSAQAPVSDEALRDAVAEAGYETVGEVLHA
jgi:copper ion binding protein